jgi:hypothetical protein
MKTSEEVQDRMKELMKPIDERIMMCDNVEDILMLASIMMTTSLGILRTTVGDTVAKGLVDDIFSAKTHI